VTTTIYIAPQQRKRLFARARKRKTSFSEELRLAVDFYLDQPTDFDRAQLKALACEAQASASRSVALLDTTIARVRQIGQRLDALTARLTCTPELR
jgi:hypothetical protein